jgi:hypothetical protein
MWTYPTQPFTFALPGFETTELDPWHKAGEEWRRLHVAWPSYLATHCAEQTLYIGADGLFRRHDYDIDIAGGTSGATTARGVSGHSASCRSATRNCGDQEVLPRPGRLPRRRREAGSDAWAFARESAINTHIQAPSHAARPDCRARRAALVSAGAQCQWPVEARGMTCPGGHTAMGGSPRHRLSW